MTTGPTPRQAKPSDDSEMYEETDIVPAGRKSRVIKPALWQTLADSAKRQKGFARTAAADVIDELRKDLASAAVRAKYDVTTATAVLENGLHKLTFAATEKPETTPDDKVTPLPERKPAK